MNDQSSNVELIQSNNNLNVFALIATCFSFASIGLAIWFNFTEYGQSMIRSFYKNKGNEVEAEDDKVQRPEITPEIVDRKLK